MINYKLIPVWSKEFMKIWLVVGLIAAISITGGIYFGTAAQQATSQTILETDKTIIDQEFQYPQGKPLVTSSIVTLPVGTETGFHIHEYPMYAFILDGEITVDYGEKGLKKYVKGDSFIEAINYEHNGKNTGDEPAKILVVLMSEKWIPR